MSILSWIASSWGRKEQRDRRVLSELSLVVITYNRPAMVQRLLRYLRAQAPEMALVLVDHGDAGSQESNARACASFSPPVRHVRLSEEMNLLDVFVQATDEFSHPYAAFCPDDDIPVVGGILDAVSMLARDPRMVCAQGYALSLTETGSGMYFGPVEDFVPGYEDEAPYARLFSMIRRYQPVFFGFYRAEVLKWSIREFVGAKIPNLMFQEFFHASLVCSRGVIGRSPSISLWRRVTGSHTDRRTIHPFHQMIDSPAGLAANYIDFREKLIPYFPDGFGAGSPASPSGVRRLLDLVFLQFLVRHIDYGELDGNIRALLGNPDLDYFSGLQSRPQSIDQGRYAALPEMGCPDVEKWAWRDLVEAAAEVSREISAGGIAPEREQRISTEMLMDAIGSALSYRAADGAAA